MRRSDGAARKGRLTLLVVATVGTALGLPGEKSEAGTSLTGVSVVAVADSGRLTMTVPAYAVVEQVIDGGGGAAQAALDSFGSSSFGSLPYPGDLVVTGPGTVSGFTGLPNPGSYPFYVAASHPTTPHQELSDPTGSYQLGAKAEPSKAQGLAQFRVGPEQGGGSGRTRSFASVTDEGNQVSAVAETLNEALSLGDGALRIASVRSRSVTTYQEGQEAPSTKTELILQGGSAGGYNFQYGPGGLLLASQGVPIPAGSGLEQLNQALAPTGISISIAGAQSLIGGASAQAFQIQMRQKSPAPGVPGAILDLRFGGAMTLVSVAGAPAPDPVASPSSGDAAEVKSEEGWVAPAPTPQAPYTGTPVIALPERAPDSGSPNFGLGTSTADMPLDVGQSSPVEVKAPAAPVSATIAPGRSRPQRQVALAQTIAREKSQVPGFIYGTVIVAGVLLVALGGFWRRTGMLRV